MELDLVHGPHSPFHIFQPYKTFVEAQVVPDCILIRVKGRLIQTQDFALYIKIREHNLTEIHLPGGCVAPKIGKVSREPVVDFI